MSKNTGTVVRAHKLSAAAKVQCYTLGQEWLERSISTREYSARGRKIIEDDRANCRKDCCKEFKIEGDAHE